MLLSMGKDELFRLTIHQLRSINFLTEVEINECKAVFDRVLLRCENCFKKITCKYYSQGSEAIFNPLMSDQHATYLYIFSNILYHKRYTELADKFYRLNKMMNGNDIYCSVELPEVFKIEHNLGVIIGPGTVMGNYLKISQHCTLGNNNGYMPVLGDHVWLLPDVKIIGNSHIGDYVVISANCYLKDTDIPSHSIVFPSFENGRQNVVVKTLTEKILQYNNLTTFHD